MQKIKVNMLPNQHNRKPEQKEYGILQKTICKEENVKELKFDMFVKFVSTLGFHWKSSYMEGGSKNENFKEI